MNLISAPVLAASRLPFLKLGRVPAILGGAVAVKGVELFKLVSFAIFGGNSKKGGGEDRRDIWVSIVTLYGAGKEKGVRVCASYRSLRLKRGKRGLLGVWVCKNTEEEGGSAAFCCLLHRS